MLKDIIQTTIKQDLIEKIGKKRNIFSLPRLTKVVVNEIQAKKTLTLKQVLDAAIIPNFSSQRIIQIINAGFDTPEKILNITVAQLEALPGIQITLAEKIYQGIQDRRDFIQSILDNVETHHGASLQISFFVLLNS
jgi:NAD-dependent DNA ligase